MESDPEKIAKWQALHEEDLARQLREIEASISVSSLKIFVISHLF